MGLKNSKRDQPTLLLSTCTIHLQWKVSSGLQHQKETRWLDELELSFFSTNWVWKVACWQRVLYVSIAPALASDVAGWLRKEAALLWETTFQGQSMGTERAVTVTTNRTKHWGACRDGLSSWLRFMFVWKDLQMEPRRGRKKQKPTWNPHTLLFRYNTWRIWGENQELWHSY